MLTKPSAQDIKALTAIVGSSYALTDPRQLQDLAKDWTSIYEPAASLALLPGTTEAVSRILAYCYDHHLPVVISGGRTGLAGGAVAQHGEVILSMSRMQRILAVDTIGMSITTEAGVTTQALQLEAAKHGLFFPLDLAAKGSCQIGGNIATNAGGLKLIRFGGTREQVLGLEVVLADGSVLDLNTNLRKNNTGYDLKQLFIGSEGTLGVVTKATLRLVPKPQHLELACLALPSSAAILAVFALCHQRHLTISAFEFFAAPAYRKVKQCFPQLTPPFSEEHPYYVLLECEGSEQLTAAALESMLAHALEEGLIQDATLAQSPQQFKALWELREHITESLAALGQVRKNDIALPIASLASFIQELEALMAQEAPLKKGVPLEAILFGHIGDGNLHINYTAPKFIAQADFTAAARSFELKVFELVRRYRGSISAEHGIGLMRRDDLHFSRQPAEIQLMQKIKGLVDPTGMLNPGKIF